MSPRSMLAQSGLARSADQEPGEVANDGKIVHDGALAPGSGAGLAGTLLAGHECVGEAGQRRAQRLGCLRDPASPPPSDQRWAVRSIGKASPASTKKSSRVRASAPEPPV